MASNWGLFFCSCRGALRFDRERLVFSTAPSVLSFGDDPAIDLGEFGAHAARERVDRVLISCCADDAAFTQISSAGNGFSPKVHVLNLKNSCFLPHPNAADAHTKANRLLRAVMEVSDHAVTPVYNRLVTGNRLLIAGDKANAADLAQRLRDNQSEIVIVLDPAAPMLGLAQAKEIYSGRVTEVKGRLGDFRVSVESAGKKRELRVSQVVIIATGTESQFKRRTGVHVLEDPGELELTDTAHRIQELTGDFLKPVHVDYNTDTCAGGVANREACGICITACPYDAISRDPENHLRMKLDHMACEGCGACVSACPTTSLNFTEPSRHELYARIAALLTPSTTRRDEERSVILFHCGEQGRRTLEKAGRAPLHYPATVLPVEVPCLRYVSEADMLGAFRLGAAGVGLLGCESCPHGERALLYHKLDFARVTLDAFALGSERLQLITVEDGNENDAIKKLSAFAETIGAPPIHPDGKRAGGWNNRDVIGDAIDAFIEQTRGEPGQRALDAAQPFAFAEVRAAGCTMCRSCVNVCPTHAFMLEESTSSLKFKHIACVACGLCEQVCPEEVITLKREIRFDRNASQYRTAAQDDSVSCVNCGKPYINRKALETVEARLFSLDSLLDTFTGNRRNLLRMCPDCRTVVAMMEVEKGWKP